MSTMTRDAYRYRDRRDAGRRLALELLPYRNDPNVAVLAIPRGGVPVGFEVANALGVPMDVAVVRKLGHPYGSELAFGALAEGGVLVLNPELTLPDHVIAAISARESRELDRRVRSYNAAHARLDLSGRTVIVVDDGLATGSSMLAAIGSARSRGARAVVVAVPVGAQSTCEKLARVCDRLVCPLQPAELWAVGEWYQDFTQTSDAEVSALLAGAGRQPIGPVESVR